MGFFDSMKQAMDAAKDALAQADEQVAAAQQSSASTVGAMSVGEDVVDGAPPHSGGDVVPGVGVVQEVRHHLESGESVWRTNVDLIVAARLEDGSLGDATSHTIWTSSRVIRALMPDHEIPVTIDRTTGLVVNVNAAAVEQAVKGE